MGTQPPYLYSPERSSRFSTSTFDPKAVTRASWEPKPPRPKQDGPYLSFNRHPDAHMVLSHRSELHAPMSSRTKSCIKWFRRLQLGLRLIQLNGAIGTLVLMILLTNVAEITAWIMRIAPGVVSLHCLYALYHLSRDAAGRTPSSSAAYQLFATIVDAGATGLYVYGVLAVHADAGSWTTRLANQSLAGVFVQAVYYTLIAVAGLHAASTCLSLWLAWAFRKISLMPPDMNPLEDHLTARPMHKRKKSSVTTFSSTESQQRYSTPMDSQRRSQMSQDSLPANIRVPFMHTRANSAVSVGTVASRGDLPSRHYQIPAANISRYSVASAESKRASRPPTSYRNSYAEVPLDEPMSEEPNVVEHGRSGARNTGKFTEAWAPTDSLISRTNQRLRRPGPTDRHSNTHSQSYSALEQPYNVDDSSDSEFADENDMGTYNNAASADSNHPNPLRSNPMANAQSKEARAQTPFYPNGQRKSVAGNSLSELSSNYRRVSGSKDITDESLAATGAPWIQKRSNVSQIISDFGLKPYGQLSNTNPSFQVGVGRKVSSGNDFDSRHSFAGIGRRNVSGKVAEEGRAGRKFA